MKAGCEVVVAGYDALPNGRYWGNSGQKWILVRDGLSAFDSTATLAVHRGNGFDRHRPPTPDLHATPAEMDSLLYNLYCRPQT